jgi:hypothetical protein
MQREFSSRHAGVAVSWVVGLVGVKIIVFVLMVLVTAGCCYMIITNNMFVWKLTVVKWESHVI